MIIKLFNFGRIAVVTHTLITDKRTNLAHEKNYSH